MLIEIAFPLRECSLLVQLPQITETYTHPHKEIILTLERLMVLVVLHILFPEFSSVTLQIQSFLRFIFSDTYFTGYNKYRMLQ